MTRTNLVVLTADVDIEASVRTLVERRAPALRIKVGAVHWLKHPGHDPGCYNHGAGLLQSFADNCDHALVVFDEAWEGRPGDAAHMQRAVELQLAADWGNRARCIVIAPEVENWVFSDSPHVEPILGWRNRPRTMRSWLQSESLWPANMSKPPDPKRAFEKVMRETRSKATAQAFVRLAEKVSVERCTDTAMMRLKETLAAWFPA